MNLTVIGPRVFIRPDQLPEMTSDGKLHLVHDRQKSTMTGTVVAIGDGAEFAKRAAGAALDAVLEAWPGNPGTSESEALTDLVEDVRENFQPEHSVAVGERVLFSPNSGEELIFEKDLLIAMSEDDILAVVDAPTPTS